MTPRTMMLVLACAGSLAAPGMLGACSNSNAVTEPNPDSGSGGDTGGPLTDSGGGNDSGGRDGGNPEAAPSCFTNPTTYLEIINACTDAAFVDKKPVLPLLQPDGSLPPLP